MVLQNVLILGNSNSLDRAVRTQLTAAPGLNVHDYRSAEGSRSGYLSFLKRANVIVSLLGPMDVDIDFEALFQAVDRLKPPLNQFVMLSAAGINYEVRGQLPHPGVSDFTEYVNEQRYAIKVVDETEIPYTILRPVMMIRRNFSTKPRIIEEGQLVPAGVVSVQAVASLITKVVTQRAYLNQSIAIINKERSE